MLQPFRNITVTMLNKTNDGMTDYTHVESGKNEIDSIRLKDDGHRYQPIKINSDGFGEIATHETDVVIGVITESFEDAKRDHTCMVIGIVPLVAIEVIKVGDRVCADTDGSVKKATSGAYAFGVALESSKANGDLISVLIGTCGGVVQ